MTHTFAAKLGSATCTITVELPEQGQIQTERMVKSKWRGIPPQRLQDAHRQWTFHIGHQIAHLIKDKYLHTIKFGEANPAEYWVINPDGQTERIEID